MQTSILQLLALVAHGNAALAGAPIGNFFPESGLFRFAETIRFADLKARSEEWEEIPYAEDPNAWFARLKAESCLGLRAQWITKSDQDWETVSFVGGGGRWIIEAVFQDGSDMWEARWQVGDRAHPRDKIWRITYGRVAAKWTPAPPSSATLEGVASALGAALGRAAQYAKTRGYASFAGNFEKALSLLNAGDSVPVPFGIAPEGLLPHAACHILAAVSSGWVFGGMGSWNDLGDTDVEYAEVSRKLFEIMNIALVTAVNVTFRI